MLSILSLVFCILIGCNVVSGDSQDIVGCGGFIKSEVEINFSVIEVWHWLFRVVVKCGLADRPTCKLRTETCGPPVRTSRWSAGY